MRRARAMESWAKGYNSEKLATDAYVLYEEF